MARSQSSSEQTLDFPYPSEPTSLIAKPPRAHGNATHEPAAPISCCACSARTPGTHLLAQVVREHKQHGQWRV
jgi:hypothetical protein